MKKIQVWYHANCPDGFAAAWTTHKVFGTDADYIPVQYGQPPPVFPDKARIHIVDFSYPPKILAEIAARCDRLIVLDHHASAERDMIAAKAALKLDNLDLQFNMNESGATMAWNYYHRTRQRPVLLDYIRDRDLWKFELPDSQAISMVVRLIGFSSVNLFPAWDDLSEKLNTEEYRKQVAEQGRLLLKFMDIQVDQMCKYSRPLCFSGGEKYDESKDDPVGFGTHNGIHHVPVTNATCFFSEVGDELCKRHPEAPFAAYYFDRNDGKRQWGLRSRRKDFDCSVVAKQFGGGGHPGAAGFTEDL